MELRLYLEKEKTIYQNLNKFRLKNSIFHGKCWCAKLLEERVMQTLQEISKRQSIVSG